MMRNATLSILFLTATTTLLPAQEPATTIEPGALRTVAWQGPGVSLEAARGKTLVVLTYVTWCPKCDQWSPDLLNQIKAAAQDKPVVIAAISTATPTVPGTVYMQQRKFVGPNIVHGHDPTINRRFGFTSLFNYAIIGPEGNVVKSGQGGSYISGSSPRKFSAGHYLSQQGNYGEFDLIRPEMADTVKQVLWPMEYGHLISQRELASVGRKLGREGRDELDGALDRFLTAQLEEIQKAAEKEVPDRIWAYEQARGMSTAYRSAPQAKTARELTTRFARDREFKRELAARKAYQTTLQAITRSPAREEALLTGFAKRFEGTFYGGVADEALAQEAANTTDGGTFGEAKPE